jgi:hypothetical protein
MKRFVFFLSLCCLAPLAPPAGAAQDSDKMVFADFESAKDDRPVTNGGGYVQLVSYQESPTVKAHYKGAGATNAPELVHLKAGDPNKVATFDYEIPAPNQWASVGLQLSALPEKDGKPVAVDVSGYKNLTLQLYATGAENIRLEFVSRGQGMNINQGDPQTTFRVKPGFNTYQVALKSLLQPAWAPVKVSTKDVLKKLTGVNVLVYCDQCKPMKGTVVVDNIVFQN